MESSVAEIAANGSTAAGGGGWKTVTYAKKQRKAPVKPKKAQANGSAGNMVFGSLKKQAEEHRQLLEAQRAAAIEAEDDGLTRLRVRDDDNSDADVAVVENGSGVEKKATAKKEKKPKVTVAEAAGKIVADDLASFLAKIMVSFESQHGVQLMRFTDYFGRAFLIVPPSQFPWTKLFRESTIAKIADIPVIHISQDVYKTSVDWISKQPLVELQTFVIWGLDSIFVDLANQQ